jgi:glycosyltransferase involved in cell wall biosynthesis
VKIICLTNIPAVFFSEIILETGKKLESEVVFIFEEKSHEDRNHWKADYKGHFLNGSKNVKNFTAILEKEKPDIILFTRYSSFFTYIGKRWCIKNKVDFFIGPHEIISPHSNGFLLKIKHFLYKKISQEASGNITMGNNSMRALSKVTENPLISVPYSFDLGVLTKHPMPQTPHLTFLYSGRLVPFRNPLLTIEVFSTLVKNNSDKEIRLIMSGQGELYNACIAKIESEKIAHLVTWLNDFKDWYDILSIYRQANVLLSLQHYGTWGLIIQEAMAAGMAVISTNTIESADNLIIHGHNGFLTTLNKEMIEDYAQQYIDNPKLIAKHGERNREISSVVDISQTSKNLADFLVKHSKYTSI